HRRRYGDPARVFVEALARGLVGEPQALRGEIDASRDRLRDAIKSARERWSVCLKAVPETRPLDEPVKDGLAVCRAARREDAPEALADSDRTLAALPANTYALTTRGLVLVKTERHEDAVAACTEALAANPLNSLAYGARGTALGALGRLDEAIDDCTRAIDLGA